MLQILTLTPWWCRSRMWQWWKHRWKTKSLKLGGHIDWITSISSCTKSIVWSTAHLPVTVLPQHIVAGRHVHGHPLCCFDGTLCIRTDHNDKYYQEAVRQVLQFAERMFVPEKGLFRHGWVEGMKDHPAFHWGRQRMGLFLPCEVLDVLPANYPGRDKIINLLQAHAFADWLPVKAKTVSGTSYSTAMILTFNLLPPPSTYTVGTCHQ